MKNRVVRIWVADGLGLLGGGDGKKKPQSSLRGGRDGVVGRGKGGIRGGCGVVDKLLAALDANLVGDRWVPGIANRDNVPSGEKRATGIRLCSTALSLNFAGVRRAPVDCFRFQCSGRYPRRGEGVTLPCMLRRLWCLTKCGVEGEEGDLKGEDLRCCVLRIVLRSVLAAWLGVWI